MSEIKYAEEILGCRTADGLLLGCWKVKVESLMELKVVPIAAVGSGQLRRREFRTQRIQNKLWNVPQN